MSSTFEMNGTVIYQGRPNHKSKDGKNWCYSIVFLVNTSVPVHDLSIVTEDKGGGLIPGSIALNPDINPEAPDADDRDDGVKDGIRLRRGKFSDGKGQGAPKPGTFVPDDKQPAARTDGKDQNRDWSSKDTETGPIQPGGWRRGKFDGDLGDPTEKTDEMRIEFEPCLQPGDGIEIKLCFDEQLDENDFIHFTPSDENGAAIGGGDTTASKTITVIEILKIIAGLASAGSKAISSAQRVPNRERRSAIAAMVKRDKQLLGMVREAAGTEIDIASVIEESGVASILDAVGPKLVIRTIGTAELAKNIKALGLADEIIGGLG